MTRTFTILSAAALVSAWAGIASAQSTASAPPPPPPPPPELGRVQVGDVRARFALSTDMEMDRTVKGAPFSAQASTVTTQTLADGNRIVQTVDTDLARDGEGRTRRELGVAKLGPWSTDAPGRIVFIRDPVANVSYTLAPDGQHATKSPLPQVVTLTAPDEPAKGKTTAAGAGGDLVKGDVVKGEVKVLQFRADVARGTGAGPGPENTFFYNGPVQSVIIADRGEDPGQKESLGEQTIEGVRATGTRVTRTIPAGEIGNERPIEIVSETWYSPDLQMVVSSRRTDPRIGETVYRLTNIVLGEPDPSLFQVPASYTVSEEPMKTFRFDRQPLKTTPPDQQPD